MPVLSVPIQPSDHIQGSDAAVITLVEYGDYQCPSCAEAHCTIEAIQHQIGEPLRFVFRYFPNQRKYPFAQNAAKAAEAAAAQGKFWQMHSCLFGNQATFDNGSLVECADAIGLDISQFLQDLSGEAVMHRIQADVSSGIASDVEQTPTFFINGIRHEEACNQTTLTAAIKAVLHQFKPNL